MAANAAIIGNAASLSGTVGKDGSLEYGNVGGNRGQGGKVVDN